MKKKESSKEETPSSEIDEDYEKWLKDFVGNPTSCELNKMEKMFSANNPIYQPPLLGA